MVILTTALVVSVTVPVIDSVLVVLTTLVVDPLTVSMAVVVTVVPSISNTVSVVIKVVKVRERVEMGMTVSTVLE